MYVPESPNCNCLVELSSKPVSATCVRLTSLSAPKLRTAASDNSETSSAISIS